MVADMNSDDSRQTELGLTAPLLTRYSIYDMVFWVVNYKSFTDSNVY